MSFFHAIDTGDLINRFSQDMSLVDRELPIAAYTSLAGQSPVSRPIYLTNIVKTLGILIVISQAIFLVLGSKYLAAMVPVAIIVLYILQMFYLRTSRQLRLLDLQAKAPLTSQLLETIQGISTIRSFRWQAATSQESISLLDRSQRPHYLLYSIQRWLTFVLDMLVTVSAVTLVLLAVATKSSSPGNIALAMFSALNFSESLAFFLEAWTSLETSLGAIARLRDFVKNTPQERDIEVVDDQKVIDLPITWPQKGQIEWRNVNAHYLKDEEQRPVLHDFSFVIKPGQKVAICGRSGSGKSSLLSTLFRLMGYSGDILFDGVDIKAVDMDTLRSSLITVPQDPILFPGSLRSNLVPPRTSAKSASISDEEIIALLQRLEVWDAIAKCGSLDTNTTDIVLSHGQKQLVCLARAIVGKKMDQSTIVILDEAMSGVDHETEKVMVDALSREFAEETVVSVVHRLETVRDFDLLLVLEDGRLTKVGSPEDMLTTDGQLRV